MREILRTVVKNPVFSNLLMVFLLLAGLLSALRMPREVFPEFSLDLITITVPYPGASPDEVEEGICAKLENELDGIDGISKVTSTSIEGMGSVLIEVESGADSYRVKDDVKSAVDRITTFPNDSEEPQVKEIVNKRSVGSIALYGNAPERTLKEVAREIKDELLAFSEISQVIISGVRDYEISIEVSEKSLQRYGLTFDQVAAAVRGGSLDLPGGKIRTKHEEIVIRTKGQKYTGEEYRDIVVLAGRDGSVVRLHEIAKITDGFVEDARLARFNGESAAMIEVFKTPSQDVVKISSRIQKYVKNKTLSSGLHLETWWDSSKVVRDRLNLLIKNGVIGLVLVFFSLWFFLDIRLSFWVAMGIPVSFAGALWIMKETGQTVNMLSMFALLMVIGMIVDDAIVIGENIYTHIMKGSKPWDAAVNGSAEVAMPVVASTVTTLAAFYPLFMVSGIMGKFIRVIPMAVIASLLASLLEAILILPVHLRHTEIVQYSPELALWRRLPKLLRLYVNNLNDFVTYKLYAPLYRTTLRHRGILISLSLSLLMFTAGFVKGGFVDFVFFPKGEEEVIYARLAYPYGTPVEVTEKAVKRIESAAWKMDKTFKSKNNENVVEKVSAMLGEWSGREREYGTHAGQVSLKLVSSEDRNIGSEKVKAAWREAVGEIPGIDSLTFETPRHGPGGKPLDIMFLGKSFDVLRKATDEVKRILTSYPGLFDIKSSFRPGKRELKVRLKDYASNLGLTLRDVATQLRQGFYGTEALRIQRGTDDIKVMIRYPASERSSLENLNSIKIRTPGGLELPFGEVADYSIEPGYSKITRENGFRDIHVTSDLDESRNNARKIVQDIKKKYMPMLRAKYPYVLFRFEGQEKESRRTMGDLMSGAALAMLAIYGIIAVMFKSYSQPLIIMFSIPFGVVGAVMGHWLLGRDLSIMSFFGIVALAGIVVNDSLVLVDFINKSLKSGDSVWDSVASAGLARFRAVMLTSVTTVAGLSPLIMEKSFQAQFLIPMAISLSFGLMFSTFVTLFIVPSLYLTLNDIKRVLRWLLSGRMPEREEVESYALQDFAQ